MKNWSADAIGLRAACAITAPASVGLVATGVGVASRAWRKRKLNTARTTPAHHGNFAMPLMTS